MAYLDYTKTEGYKYISDTGIVYDLLEGKCLEGTATSDMIFMIMSDGDAVFNGIEYIGFVYGATLIEEKESRKEIMEMLTEYAKDYEQEHPEVVKYYGNTNVISMNREEILLELLADTIPSDPNEFNSETGFGEPQHWMSLPYDRSLEIVYEETGDDNRYYTWRVHCNEKEFDNDDFRGTMGVMDINDSDDLDFDTRIRLLNWAIEVALEKPRS